MTAKPAVAVAFLVCVACSSSESGTTGQEDAASPDAATSAGGATTGGGGTASGGARATGGAATGGKGAGTGGTGTGGTSDAGAGGTPGAGGGDAGTPDGGSCTFDAPCAEEGATCGGPCPSACAFCNILRCEAGKWSGIEVFPAPCFDCGPGLRCQVSAEYCDVQHSDVGGEPDDYACERTPQACARDVTCACIEREVTADGCSSAEAGEVVVEHAGG